MNTFEISKKFNTKEKCISYLEQLRWGKKPVCTYCGGTHTVKMEGRHKCYECTRSFSVFIGTVFEGCRMEMPKMFMLISLILTSKKGISASQLARDLGVTLKTAWYSAMRIRCAMIETITDLHGIVEADESYFGGKPKNKNNYNKATLRALDTNQPKRGRGTDKEKVVGFIERNGRVSVKILDKLTTQNLLSMLHNTVDEDSTVLMTDDFKSYKSFDDYVERFVIQHSSGDFSKGKIHINTIEGFWSILKNGIKGNYQALSKKYLPFYLAEFSYKYNRRNLPGLKFESFLKDALNENKCMVCMNLTEDVNKIVYPKFSKDNKSNIKQFNKSNKEHGKFKRKKIKN